MTKSGNEIRNDGIKMLHFLRPQNAAAPHFEAVKMKSETVKLKISSPRSLLELLNSRTKISNAFNFKKPY